MTWMTTASVQGEAVSQMCPCRNVLKLVENLIKMGNNEPPTGSKKMNEGQISTGAIQVL